MRRVERIAPGVLALAAALAICACRPGVPKEYIQPDEMEDILYDYYVSQALAVKTTTENSPAYEKNMYYHAVLKKHGLTEAEYDSSLVYYYTHAERLRDIYDNVVERIENDAANMGASVAAAAPDNYYYDEDGDTTDLWTEAAAAVLTPTPPYNRLDFAIDCDSTYRPGDTFLLSFNTTFVYQSGNKDAVAYIALTYDNDSVSTHYSRITVSGKSRLRVEGNKNITAKNIKGFVYAGRGNDRSGTRKLMFMDNIRLLRFHPLQPIEEETDTADTAAVTLTDSIAAAATDPMAHDSIMTPGNDSIIAPIKKDSLTKHQRKNAQTRKKKRIKKKR